MNQLFALFEIATPWFDLRTRLHAPPTGWKRWTKSKFNNTAHLLAVRFLAAFFQPIHTIVSYSLLIHGPLVSLTKFLGSCAQAGCKLTARFSSLSSLLSSTSASSQLTAYYNTCSKWIPPSHDRAAKLKASKRACVASYWLPSTSIIGPCLHRLCSQCVGTNKCNIYFFLPEFVQSHLYQLYLAFSHPTSTPVQLMNERINL